MNRPIKSYSLPELEVLMADLGQPKYRAKQLAQWLYVRNAQSYDEMTDLSAKLRETLKSFYPLTKPTIANSRESHDGTRKYVLTFHDGAQVETVAIPSHDRSRLTVCFSTQVGCAMSCAFCATGKEGFSRNLTPGEMVDQILIAQNDLGTRVTNVVAMGQGEPFLNYDHTLSALRILNDQKGVAIGARRITISTCGVLTGIEKLAREPEQFTLAVSLHAARQPVRDLLMPAMARSPLSHLKRTLCSYGEIARRRVTLEYLMIDGVNDAEEDLTALLSFCRGLLCHVNMLPMNPVEDSPFTPSPQKVVHYWLDRLHEAGIEATLRTSRGSDIAGACGQLKNSILVQPLY